MATPMAVEPYSAVRAVALLGGNADEAAVLRAARRAESLLHRPIAFAWLAGTSAPRPLIRELAHTTELDEIPAARFRELLNSGGVGSVILSPSMWRSMAGVLWQRLGRASAYVCRRAALPPLSVLCCADSDETAEVLLERVSRVLPRGRTSLTVLRAVPPPPSWAVGMLSMFGCPGAFTTPDEAATAPLRIGVRALTVAAPPARAVESTLPGLDPDLLVVGWHHHSLPLPEPFLHPTAWRLSISFAKDVLLVPVCGARTSA